MRKQEPVIIRTPFPTTDEVAAMMGLTRRRRAELEQIYQEVRQEMEEEDRRKRARRARAKKSKKRS